MEESHGDPPSSDDEEDTFGGVVMPSVRAMRADEEDDDEEDGEEAGGVAEHGSAVDPAVERGADGADADENNDAAEGEPSGLPDALSAFDETRAPPGAELDPFRMAGAAPLAPRAAPLPVGAGAGRCKTKFDFVKHHQEHLANRKLFVGGLPPSATEPSLIKFFSRFGKVQEVKLGTHADSGRSRGFAFVVFTYHKGARYCLEQGHEKEMDGRMIRCEVAASGERPAGAPPRPQRRAPPPTDAAGGSRVTDASARGADRPPQQRAAARAAQQPAVAAAAAVAPTRAVADADASAGVGGADGADDGAHDPKAKRRRGGIVTITRREDAEPVDKKKLSLREIFPKEFWRV
ncbi:hypothetical protein KFE25_010705 [Diacronema lutheri]|uniref:RRM domain-containing protein n=1 Tax=Diacronema lutheri TaxID=2081491 RepID=A0A8J5XHH3_DIALT|nr:hypothetical protein KFE25_010705 [Diacronema lutheri]